MRFNSGVTLLLPPVPVLLGPLYSDPTLPLAVLLPLLVDPTLFVLLRSSALAPDPRLSSVPLPLLPLRLTDAPATASKLVALAAVVLWRSSAIEPAWDEERLYSPLRRWGGSREIEGTRS